MSQNYFIIPPTSIDDDSFESIWEFDKQNSTIAIGWGKTGDLSGLSKEEIASAYDNGYPDRSENKHKRGSDLKNICTFYLDIEQGDIIIARRGLKIILGIGRVTRTAFYDKALSLKRNEPDEYSTPHFLGINWLTTGLHNLDGRIRNQSTVRQVFTEEYDSYGISIKEGIQIEDPSDEIEFSREGMLETFLVEHLDEVFGNKYELYEDEISGENGLQYDTKEAGRIDILVREKDSNSYVVIELKKGKSSDVVVGQIMRYMGWVRKNLCDNNEVVKGLIICKQMDKRLELALNNSDNIEVKLYKFNFELLDGK